jgi:Ca2+-binding EF-hand superfamily protein
MSSSSIGLSSSGLLQALQQATDGGSLSTDGTKSARKKLQAGTNSTETSALEKLFSVVDSNRDGQVSKTELSSFIETLRSRSDLVQVQEQHQQAQQLQLPSADAILASADTDGDGALSLTEFKADLAAHAPAGADAPGDSGTEKRFSRLDTNKDGVVSQDELNAAFGSTTATSASTASPSSATDLLGMLTQAISAYSSTSTSANATGNAGLLGSLIKAV